MSTSTVPVIRSKGVLKTIIQSINLIGQETDKTDSKTTIKRQEIHEALTDTLLNNHLCSSHGKPVVTCLAMQSKSKKPDMSVDAISTCMGSHHSALFN
jgi:hypothetical protein